MQTFLVTRGYYASAKQLDDRRLGKQRLEAKQILEALLRLKAGEDPSTIPWVNHPAVRMWEGYELSLAQYGEAVCWTWKKRGFEDDLQWWFLDLLPHHPERWYSPPWWRDPMFHTAHRSALMRKAPEHYGQFWNTKSDLPYLWPVVEKTGAMTEESRYYFRISKGDEKKIDEGELRLPRKWEESGRVIFSP